MITPDDLTRATALWGELEQAVADGSELAPRLAQALAEARAADGQVIARLRAALAWYTTATQVTSWGYQEEEDIGRLARETLAATPEGQGEPLVAATRELLRTLAVAQQAERAHAALSVQFNEALATDDPDELRMEIGKQADASRQDRDAAQIEVEQARRPGKQTIYVRFDLKPGRNTPIIRLRIGRGVYNDYQTTRIDPAAPLFLRVQVIDSQLYLTEDPRGYAVTVSRGGITMNISGSRDALGGIAPLRRYPVKIRPGQGMVVDLA